jgi:hypothetical protein
MEYVILVLCLIIFILVFLLSIKRTPEHISLLEAHIKDNDEHIKALETINETYIFMIDVYRKERERLKKEIEELNRLVG